MASFKQRARNASRGVLRPSSRQTVTPAIYDELEMSRGVSDVVFDNVVFLDGARIRNNSASGTIIVPEGTIPPDLGGSLVNVLYRSLSQICEQYNA